MSSVHTNCPMYQLSTLKGWAVVSLVSNSMAFTAPYEKLSALYTAPFLCRKE